MPPACVGTLSCCFMASHVETSRLASGVLRCELLIFSKTPSSSAGSVWRDSRTSHFTDSHQMFTEPCTHSAMVTDCRELIALQ